MAMNLNTETSRNAELESMQRKEHGLQNPFARSVPGQSLTQPMGKYQWEKPARIDDIEEAHTKVMRAIALPHNIQNILSLVDAGVSIESMTRAITFNGFVEGEWTPDISEMLNPIIVIEILALAKTAGVTDIRIMNNYPDTSIKNSKIIQIMKQLNPKKYDERRRKALRQKEPVEEELLNLPEENSFMSVLSPEPVEKSFDIDRSNLQVSSFVEEPSQIPNFVEQPTNDLPVQEQEEELLEGVVQ